MSPGANEAEVHVVEKTPPMVDKDKGKYYVYHKTKTHDTQILQQLVNYVTFNPIRLECLFSDFLIIHVVLSANTRIVRVIG